MSGQRHAARSQVSRFESRLCCSPAVQLQASCLTSLSTSDLICKRQRDVFFLTSVLDRPCLPGTAPSCGEADISSLPQGAHTAAAEVGSENKRKRSVFGDKYQGEKENRTGARRGWYGEGGVLGPPHTWGTEGSGREHGLSGLNDSGCTKPLHAKQGLSATCWLLIK